MSTRLWFALMFGLVGWELGRMLARTGGVQLVLVEPQPQADAGGASAAAEGGATDDK